MKKKKDGFIAVECILSLAIIGLSTYVVSTSLKDNYLIVNNNGNKIEMLNIAKSNLQNLKVEVKHGKKHESNTIIEEIDSYQILKTIEKQELYYQCYKVNVEVKKNDEIVELTSYVFQQ